jgi:hypothetical protein
MKKVLTLSIIGLVLGLTTIITYISIPGELIQEDYYECTNYNNMVCLGGVWKTRTVTNPDWNDSLVAIPAIAGFSSVVLLAISGVLFLKSSKDTQNVFQKTKSVNTIKPLKKENHFDDIEIRLKKVKKYKLCSKNTIHSLHFKLKPMIRKVSSTLKLKA